MNNDTRVTINLEKLALNDIEAVAQALLLIDGLSEMEIDTDSSNVSFCADSDGVRDAASKALQKAGFKVTA